MACLATNDLDYAFKVTGLFLVKQCKFNISSIYGFEISINRDEDELERHVVQYPPGHHTADSTSSQQWLIAGYEVTQAAAKQLSAKAH